MHETQGGVFIFRAQQTSGIKGVLAVDQIFCLLRQQHIGFIRGTAGPRQQASGSGM